MTGDAINQSISQNVSADILSATKPLKTAMNFNASRSTKKDSDGSDVDDSDEEEIEKLDIIERQQIDESFWTRFKYHQELLQEHLLPSLTTQYPKNGIDRKEMNVEKGHVRDVEAAKKRFTDRQDDDVQIVQVTSRSSKPGISMQGVGSVGQVPVQPQQAPSIPNPPIQRPVSHVQQVYGGNVSLQGAGSVGQVTNPSFLQQAPPPMQRQGSYGQQMFHSAVPAQGAAYVGQVTNPSFVQQAPNPPPPMQRQGSHGQQLYNQTHVRSPVQAQKNMPVLTAGHVNNVPLTLPLMNPKSAQGPAFNSVAPGNPGRVPTPWKQVEAVNGTQPTSSRQVPPWNQVPTVTAPIAVSTTNPHAPKPSTNTNVPKSKAPRVVQQLFPTYQPPLDTQSKHSLLNPSSLCTPTWKIPISVFNQLMALLQQKFKGDHNKLLLEMGRIKAFLFASTNPSLDLNTIMARLKNEGTENVSTIKKLQIQPRPPVAQVSQVERITISPVESTAAYEPTNSLIALQKCRKPREEDRFLYSDILDIGTISAFNETFGKTFMKETPASPQFVDFIGNFVDLHTNFESLMSWYHDYLHFVLDKAIVEINIQLELEKFLQSQERTDLVKIFKDNEIYNIAPKYHVQTLLLLQGKILDQFRQDVNELDSIPYRQSRLNSDKLKLEAEIKVLSDRVELLKKGEKPEEEWSGLETLETDLQEKKNIVLEIESSLVENSQKLIEAKKLKEIFTLRAAKNYLGSDRDGKYYWAILPAFERIDSATIFTTVGILVEGDLLNPAVDRDYRYVRDLKELSLLCDVLDPALPSEKALKEKLTSFKMYLLTSMTEDQVNRGFAKFPIWVLELLAPSKTPVPHPCKFDAYYGNLMLESLFNYGQYCGMTAEMKEAFKSKVGKPVHEFKSLLYSWISDGKWNIVMADNRGQQFENVESFCGLAHWARSKTATAKSHYISNQERLRLEQIQKEVEVEAYVVGGKRLRASGRDKEESPVPYWQVSTQSRRSASVTSSMGSVGSRGSRGSRTRNYRAKEESSSVEASDSDQLVTSASEEIDELVESDDLMDYDTQPTPDGVWPSANSDGIDKSSPVDSVTDDSVSVTDVSDDDEITKSIHNTGSLSKVIILIDNTKFKPILSKTAMADGMFGEQSGTTASTDPIARPTSKTDLAKMLYGNKNLPTFKKKKVDTEDQNDKQLAKDLFGSDDESPKKKPSSSKAKLPKVDTSAKLSREMEMELFGTISSEEEVVISKPRPQVVVINSSDDDLVTSVKRPLVRTSGSEMTPPSASKQKVLKKRRVEDSNPAIVIPSSQSPASRQFKPVQPKASNSSKSFGLPTFKKLVSAPSLHRPSPHSSPKKTIQTEFPSYRKQTTTIEKPKQDPLPEARKVPTDPRIRGIDTIETDSPQRISTESQRAPTMQTTLTYEPFRPSTSQSANQKTHFVLESDDSDEDQTPKPLDIRMNF